MNCRIRRPYGTSNNIIGTSIMTGDTVIADTRVSKNRWEKYSNRMAKVTILNRWQMGYRLN